MANDSVANAQCSICTRSFDVRFRYQVREEQGRFLYFCSQACQQDELKLESEAVCSVCRRGFKMEFPYQAEVTDSSKQYYCSTQCRSAGRMGIRHMREPRRIAVFNHKGGTGKTTTAVTLAAGIARRGRRVLLIDADGQGNVAASLGIESDKTLYHVLAMGLDVQQACINVRPNLDVLLSNELLAAAELYLAGKANRDRVMRERLGKTAENYDALVIDCAPALSLMNQNALVYADSVIVPVSCDYLSLVGVRQVMRTMRNVRELLQHDVALLGVLPTFYDVRNRICRDAVQALTEHFGERCLSPIRVNTKLKEAPSANQTIFEYAPDSNGALDYLSLVDHILGIGKEPAQISTPAQLPAFNYATSA